MNKPRKPSLPTTPKLTVPPAREDGSGFYTSYSEHSSILRSWLVAYGIGAPVLILSQENIWAVLAKSGNLHAIAFWFLMGVCLQVLLASINKSVMWACYYGTEAPQFKKTWRYKFADWISAQFAIDIFIDFISMASFAWATYLCFISLAYVHGV